MPGLIPASAITCSASPRRSRASSVEKVSLTVGATSRWAAGNCGSLGCARQPARSRQAAAAVLLHTLDLDGFAGYPLRQRRGHEAVEIAVQYVTGRGRRHARAQVLDQLIGLQ